MTKPASSKSNATSKPSGSTGGAPRNGTGNKPPGQGGNWGTPVKRINCVNCK